MRILVFGGAGFVGLNIAAALLACGHAVTLFDRAGLPPDARKEFALHGDRLTAIQGELLSVAAWYDNEMGYATRLAEMAAHIAAGSGIAKMQEVGS